MNRSIPIIAVALALLLFGPMATGARADLTITADNVSMRPGDTATMNFYISGSPSNDTLSYYFLDLQITPLASAPQTLSFLSGADQPSPYGTNYVFYQQSGDEEFSQPYWSNPSLTVYPNDTINGGDLNFSAQGYTDLPQSGSGSLLLTSVKFVAQPGTPIGSQFSVSLIAGTEFDQTSSDTNVSYQFSGGTVTIMTVPEPGSGTLGMIGVILSSTYGMFRLRRHRRRPT